MGDTYYRKNFDEEIKEQRDIYLGKGLSKSEIIDAFKYFGLSMTASEDEISRAHRNIIKKILGNEESQKIANHMYDVIKKYLKYKKTALKVNEKKKQMIERQKFLLIANRRIPLLKEFYIFCEELYNARIKEINNHFTIIELDAKEESWEKNTRQNYSKALKKFLNIDIVPENITTLDQLTEYCKSLIKQRKIMFLTDLSKEYEKREMYEPVLSIIKQYIEDIKIRVNNTDDFDETLLKKSMTELNEKVDKLISNYSSLKRKINELKEKGGVETQEKYHDVFEKINELKNEDDLQKLWLQIEQIEKIINASNLKKKKEEEKKQVDSFIAEMISKYNGLMIDANGFINSDPNLMHEYIKVMALIRDGLSNNRNIEYYKNIEVVLADEQTEKKDNLLSGIYIKRSSKVGSDDKKDEQSIYVFNQEVGKFEIIKTTDSSSYVDGFVDIKPEELKKDYISLEDFLLGARKYDIDHSKLSPISYLEYLKANTIPTYYNYGQYYLKICGGVINENKLTSIHLSLFPPQQPLREQKHIINREHIAYYIRPIKEHLQDIRKGSQQQSITNDEILMDGTYAVRK